MFLRPALARLEISVWSSNDIQKSEKEIIVYYIVRCIIRNLLKLMYSEKHVLSFKLSTATFVSIQVVRFQFESVSWWII